MGLVENVAGRLPIGGEFQGYNGDCVEYSIMVAHTAASPQYPCDRAELDRLTAESITAGQAGPAGQMTDANAAWLCTTEKIPFQQIPWNLDGLYYWLGAAFHPVVLGMANGQAMPGNEPNVHGHAVCFLGHDAAGFIIANGDSTNGRAGKLDYGVLVQQILAAQPTTMTVIHPQVAPAPVDLAGIKNDATQIQALASDIIKKAGG